MEAAKRDASEIPPEIRRAVSITRKEVLLGKGDVFEIADQIMAKHTTTLQGELYIDEHGEAHFICHTPGEMGFHEARAGLLKFIKLLQSQVDEQRKCPHHVF